MEKIYEFSPPKIFSATYKLLTFHPENGPILFIKEHGLPREMSLNRSLP
jgi:hypothetical protein